MKAHEGWIDVQSDGVGKGSVFTVELPAFKAGVKGPAENAKKDNLK
jgi:signal transduction histidine kinase